MIFIIVGLNATPVKTGAQYFKAIAFILLATTLLGYASTSRSERISVEVNEHRVPIFDKVPYYVDRGNNSEPDLNFILDHFENNQQLFSDSSGLNFGYGSRYLLVSSRI